MAPLIEFRSVSYSYPDGCLGLRDINLKIGEAEVVLLLGASGCGKSTLLRAVNGLVPHFAGGTFGGQVRVGGCDTRSCRPRDLATMVGMVFQDPESQAVMTTVEREIAFGLENMGIPAPAIGRLVEESLVSLGLSRLRRASLATLSGGELQKVALAAVLALQPQIILLDEPTSQLDPVSAEELLSALRRLSEDTGSTILLAEHRVDRCLHLASRVLFLEQGSIVKDAAPRELCSWADTHKPLYLPPVTSLLAASPHAQGDGQGGKSVLPLTVKEARRALGDRGLTARRVRPPLAPSSHRGVARIVAHGLTVGYPPDAPVLDGLSLAIHEGEFTALMGENGSGKSTLIRHLMGLSRPLAGQVMLGGTPIESLPAAQRATRCALLTQNPRDYFVKDTVEEELRYSLTLRGMGGVELEAEQARITQELHLQGLLDRHPRDLSGGERTRAALGLVAAGHPDVLVLDEPTRGLDPETKLLLGTVLKDWVGTGTAVLLVTHDVEFAARFADRVVILGDGGIVADGPAGEVLDGSLFFSTQINRLLRRSLPGVLVVEDVALGGEEATCAA
ncbi:MAG: energy-coupling factor ABC transporter ATP-binding protein [Gaiellales bacterium]|nr:energy-coupling factor ABC transporter ATP-binding protein [Gaiellales bacterium]